ncbi:MAG: calcium-binding protein [Paracoccaceae bacterium]
MLNATNGISGTEAEDTLNGTDDGDFIRGLAGADTITAGLGNDVIFGGEGVDRVDGGAGNDLLWDPNGEDVLLGGSGDDIMIGGSTAFAGDGDDLIISTSTAGGPVDVFGGSGADTMIGSDQGVEIYRYNLFAPDSTPDTPDTILNFQRGQDSFQFGELIARVDFLGDAAFSGNANPNLGIEARFADGRLEFDEDSDAVDDKVIILEGIQSVTEAELFGFA